MRQGKIPLVPLFVEGIVMKVSTPKQLICEDSDEKNKTEASFNMVFIT